MDFQLTNLGTLTLGHKNIYIISDSKFIHFKDLRQSHQFLKYSQLNTQMQNEYNQCNKAYCYEHEWTRLCLLQELLSLLPGSHSTAPNRSITTQHG